MKRAAVFLLSLTLISCSSSKYLENYCNENLKFKARFFKSIKHVEDYTVERTANAYSIKTVKASDFFKSLDFITKYTKTPYPNVFNLQTGYLSIAEFQKDKKEWVNWYELNKCKNLH